jgi:hypothetical protein
MTMLAPVTHILPLTTIRRERLLPAAGKVVVRQGQKVKATDVIAEANLAPRHVLLDVARGLGVARAQADGLIQREAGEDVVEGDVIANRGGLARRVIRTPVTGRVVMIGEGQVLIEAEGKPYQVLSGLPGVVMDLVDKRGAIVETTGALIQGVWGNRLVDFGVLRVVAQSPEDLLTPDHLDVRMRGFILLAGQCADESTLEAAKEMTVRGLILGSMAARLIPVAKKMRFPIIVIEGFGDRSMNAAAFKLLSTNDNRDVSINAEPFDRLAGTRPEVVIPLPAPSQPELPQDVHVFEPGKRVHITRGSRAGENGSLSGLKSGLASFPSGVRSAAARVSLDSGDTVIVPLENLEIIQ